MNSKFVPLLILAAVVQSSCGAGSTVPTEDAGVYAMTSADGKPLPYRRSDGRVIQYETLTVSTDGTVQQSGSLASQGTNFLYTDVGTFALSGSTVTFHLNASGISGTGTLSGRIFTLPYDGVTFVYTKQ